MVVRIPASIDINAKRAMGQSAGEPSMETQVYVDGEFLPQSEAKISVFDHGLLYGDGVFEGIRAYNGRIFKLERHVDRMFRSAHAIHLTIPHTREEFANLIREACRRNGMKNGYIRPVITRGPGDLGLDPRKCKRGASVIIITANWDSLYDAGVYERGLRLITAAVRRVPPQSLSPSIKSLNYLNQILARIHGNESGADEVLLLDMQGYVSEASADNVFVVRDGKVLTPPTSTNLPGVTRETVLELCQKLGYPAAEALFTLFEVYTADECFITGTAAEVGPVVQVDGRKVGDGRPGKITTHLMRAYQELVTTTGTPI
jgi:branched-chain amino acid aminotransferase